MTVISHFISLTWEEKGQLKILLIKTGLDIVNEKLPTPEYVGNLSFQVRAAWVKENNDKSTQHTRRLCS